MRVAAALFAVTVILILAWLPRASAGEVCNLRILTDATPDYTDMPGMIRSMTAKWPTDQEKCWAIWYWNHLGRRQTMPMIRHGLACADPIRQFNDYGYMMCSTIAGANCAIWHNMGYAVRYYDVWGHTLPEVQYGGRWHMYDDSMSALFTLCDGKTIAGVNDIAKEGACEASGGKREKAHVARYHCLTATSPNGWLSGADCPRDLASYGNAFAKPAFRYYYNDWDWGHRYTLNLREGEIYTRHYQRLDGYDYTALYDAKRYKSDPLYFVPNYGDDGKPVDPELCNVRFFIRGNGLWNYCPPLTEQGLREAYGFANVAAAGAGGLSPAKAAQPAEVTFRVQSANVTTGQIIRAVFFRKTADDLAGISVSTSNGLRWQEVWKAGAVGRASANLKLGKEINGAYEVLVKVSMQARSAAQDVRLEKINIQTVTQVNSKTQPQLALGKNTIYVGQGEQTEAIVFWPDLQGDAYKELAVDYKNIKTKKKHDGWNAVLEPARPGEEAYLVYRMDAPNDVVRVVFGGRFYNRDIAGSAKLLYSVDAGKTWTRVWSADNPKGTQPWDLVHYAGADMPKGTRSVLVKYLLNKWGLYALRAEADYLPKAAGFRPMEVTFTWTERKGDDWFTDAVKRSHTQLVEHLPLRYTINVGGTDVHETESLRVNLKGSAESIASAASPAPGAAAPSEVKYGYSDGKDAGGEKFYPRWVTCGKNLAQGKDYTTSVPSVTDYGARPAAEKRLTDGIVGPDFVFSWGAGHLWKPDVNPAITVDLGSEQKCAAFGVNFLGMGDLHWQRQSSKTRIEVLTSSDGKQYRPAGLVNTALRLKDLPINWIRPDDPQFGAHTFYLVPPQPVRARYVRYKVASSDFFCPTELFVWDSYKSEPFDLRLTLPDEALPAPASGSNAQP